MKTNKKVARFKMEVIVFSKARKRPICGRSLYSTIDNFNLTHSLLEAFGKTKQVNKDVGYSIKTYVTVTPTNKW